MNESQILDILIDNKKNNDGKSYFKDGKILKSRCRIDASLFLDIIMEYLYSNETIVTLTEKYLEKTRNIRQKDRDFKKSNGMDISALFAWLKIKNKNRKEVSLLLSKKNVTIEDIKDALLNYVNNKIYSFERKDLIYQWSQFYFNERKLEKNDNTEIIFNDYLKKNNLKIIENKKLTFNKVKKFNDISSSNFKLNQEMNTKVGFVGEQLVFNYLCEKYKEENVKWVSKLNIFENHDFEIKINNKIFFIEVKSTINTSFSRFFISRNEYQFYKKNRDKYLLFFVSNIKLNDKVNFYNPNLTIFEKPEIIIDDEKIGYENNKFFISPNSFIGSL